MSIQKVTEVAVSANEIREAWAKVQEGIFPFSQLQRSTYTYKVAEQWRGNVVDEWMGDSGEGINHKLKHGYWAEGDGIVLKGESQATGIPQLILDEEEGDLLIDAALAGDDFRFAQWQQDVSFRALTIRARINFSAATDAKVIGDYLGWVLRMIDATAEKTGMMPTVEAYTQGSARFKGEKQGIHITRTTTVLSAPGAEYDPVSWRVFFSKGGFRTLGFVCYALAGDKLGKATNSALGYSANDKWRVSLEDDILTIHAPQTAEGFPEAEMTAQVQALLA